MSEGKCKCPKCGGLNKFRSPFHYTVGIYVLGHGCRHCDSFSVPRQKVVEVTQPEKEAGDGKEGETP